MMKIWKSLSKLAATSAGLVWIYWATQVYSGGPLFVPAPDSPIEVGPGSGEVVLADINRDGHLDMIIKHLLSGIVAVRLGDGKGHFVPAAGSPITLGYQPGAIAVGDVNNDGILDLAIASKDSDSEKVNILLGNGRGAFSVASGSPFAVSASFKGYKPSIQFADVNEDGKPDIVMANGQRNTIEILFGDGRGGFSRGPVVRLEHGRAIYSFAVGDVDRDGHLDLVAASAAQVSGPGFLVIKRGDGKGAFRDAPGSPLSVPPGPRVETLADVNGDQRLDIVLSHARSNLLAILLNEKNGVFTPAAGSPLKIGMPAFAVVVADANRDNKADILAATVGVAAPFESKIEVLLGDKHGFVPAPGSPFRAGPGAYKLAVGDVNEDGKLDVAASSFEGNAVTVLLGR